MKIVKILTGQRKSLLRDPMSLLLSFLPILLFLLLRFGFPVLTTYVAKWVDLNNYYGFIKILFYILTPTLMGIVLGLLLMDERDMDVLSFIAITPFSLSGYIMLKAVTGAVVGFIMNILLALLLKELFSISLILTFMLCSLLVPLFAFSIFTFSKNKVEALTKGKLMTFVMLGAVIGYFIKSNWGYIAGVLPPFWIEKLYFSMDKKQTVIFFIPGLLITTCYLFLLKKRVG